MKFTDLEIHPDLMKAIDELGFTDLTLIQEKSLQPALVGRDIAGISQTGTGKTVAFLLPILHRIMTENLVAPAALIVAPTRELCLQISEEAEHLTKYHPITVCPVYGGESYDKQEARLRENPAVIAATPGRLIDYLRQGKIDMSNLKFLVLDEADRMFDMGFIRDIRFIMKRAPEGVQTMLYSATLSYYVIRLAGEHMRDPEEVRVESDTVAIDKIDQQLMHLGRDEKRHYLANQILAVEKPRAIVFTNLKTMVPTIVNNLRNYGIAAVGISSLLDQKKRVRLLKDFKLGKYSVLVATDVASRGLDVDDVTHVFNYDLPMDGESYVHRIGRTARAGKTGISISYCSEQDYEALPKIERYLAQKIPVVALDEALLVRPRGDFVPFGEPMTAGISAGERMRLAPGERGPREREPQRGGRTDRGERGGHRGYDRGRGDQFSRKEQAQSSEQLNPEPVATGVAAADSGEPADAEARPRKRRRRRGGGGGRSEGGSQDRPREARPESPPARRVVAPAPARRPGGSDADSIRESDRAALLSRRPGQPHPDTNEAAAAAAATAAAPRKRRRRRGGRSQGQGDGERRPESGGRTQGGGGQDRSGGRGGPGSNASGARSRSDGRSRRPRNRTPRKEEKKGLLSKILSVFKRK